METDLCSILAQSKKKQHYYMLKNIIGSTFKPPVACGSYARDANSSYQSQQRTNHGSL